MRVRCTPLFQTLAALGGVVLLATACPPPSNGDAGPDAGDTGDAGGGGGDAGPDALPEGESCTVANDQCDDGLICMPSTLNPNLGVCRVQCGQLENGVPTEDPTACGEGTTCQTVLTPDLGALVGIVCLPPVGRDEMCFAVSDEDACAEDQVCEITGAVQNEAGDIEVTGLNCKLTCEYGAENAGENCPVGEDCFPSENPFLDVELSDPNDPESSVECDLAICEAGDPACPCDAAAGYACTPTAAGTNICARSFGACATPVEVFVEDFSQITADYLCNNIDDHRACDERPYRELDTAEMDGAEVFCLPLEGNDRVCLAICSQAAFDYNGDGMIGEREGHVENACREGEVCSLDTLGLYLRGSTACDPAACPAGEICGACGGEGRCLRQDDGSGICIGVFGTCSVAPPPTDGGVPDDAGMTGDDAGMTGSDAGMTGSDAGTTGSDAGMTGSDAGTTGADAGTTGDAGAAG